VEGVSTDVGRFEKDLPAFTPLGNQSLSTTALRGVENNRIRNLRKISKVS
jgi:hypothetical protein